VVLKDVSTATAPIQSPKIASDEPLRHGTGDLEITVASSQDLGAAKEFINAAYQKVGG
jgi:hypothetical protein